jgi:hypothetical protein
MPSSSYRKTLQHGSPVKLACATVLIVGSIIMSSADGAANADPKRCPTLMAIVDGREIYPGALPMSVPTAAGHERTIMSVQMALTPLEFETASRLKLRAPASVIRPTYCDESARFRRVQFMYFWSNGKLLAPAQVDATQAPKDVINVGAWFEPAPYVYALPLAPRSDLSTPESLPQFGLTAHTRLGSRDFDRYWDVFVLNETRSGVGDQIALSCRVRKAALLDGQFPDRYESCRSHIAIRNGFAVIVDIQAPHLKHANSIFSELIQVLRSYVVKE